MADALCHPCDLAGVGISSGWITANSLCHPDNILFHLMSSGWLNCGWYLIRMSYNYVIMSSGWDTLPFLSHPDEIANFDFPQHAVALHRFRNFKDDMCVGFMYGEFLLLVVVFIQVRVSFGGEIFQGIRVTFPTTLKQVITLKCI